MHLTDPLNDEQGRGGLTERQLNSIRAIVYLALLVLVVVFGLIKLWQMPMASADFKFTDFVVVGLAMFSIWLSVSILDRATQQSNRYYDSAASSLRELGTELEGLRQEIRAMQNRSTPAAVRAPDQEHLAGVPW